MNINILKSQIREIQYRLSVCKDPIEYVVLQGILQTKMEHYHMFKKKKSIEKDLDDKLDKLIEGENKKISDNAYDRLLKENEDEEVLVEKRGKMEKYWNKVADPKYKEEVEKDFSNNKLMERLNGELDFRIHGTDKKTIIKPFATGDDDEDSNDEEEEDMNEFVKVKKFGKHGIPSNDFSSKRMVGRRRNL